MKHTYTKFIVFLFSLFIFTGRAWAGELHRYVYQGVVYLTNVQPINTPPASNLSANLSAKNLLKLVFPKKHGKIKIQLTRLLSETIISRKDLQKINQIGKQPLINRIMTGS